MRVQEGQAGSSRVQDTRQIVAARSANPSLSPLARFQSRRFSPCRRCLASGAASSRGAAQPATDTSTTSRGDSKSQPTWSSEHQRNYDYHEDTRAPRYYRQCLKLCRTIVRDCPCHNPCVLRKNHDGVCCCAYHRVVRPDGVVDTVTEYTRLPRPVSVFIETCYLVLTAGLNVLGGSPAPVLFIAAALMCMLYSLGSSFGVTVVGLRSCMDEEPLEYAVAS